MPPCQAPLGAHTRPWLAPRQGAPERHEALDHGRCGRQQIVRGQLAQCLKGLRLEGPGLLGVPPVHLLHRLDLDEPRLAVHLGVPGRGPLYPVEAA